MLNDDYTIKSNHPASMRMFIICCLCLLLASLATPSSDARDAPPLIPGNPGIPGLLAQIESLQQQIYGLEAQVATRDTQIAELQAQIGERDAQIDDLEEQIGERDAQIDDLEEQIASLQSHNPIARTGQIECWDEDGNLIDCAETGQDGDVQAGIPWPTPRFTDNDDGTFTDNLTGLVWLKDVSCLARMPWQTALEVVKNLENGTCSLTDGSSRGDWRLPNVKELQSLVDFSHYNYSIDESAPFIPGGIQVWSSTTVQSAPEHAWYVSFGDGTTLQDFREPEATLLGGGSKVSFPGVVWPIRGQAGTSAL